MYRVILYKTPFTPKPQKENTHKMNPINRFSETSGESSIRRTRRTLHDYVKCNDFDLFVTFTYDPKKIDRYDIDATFQKMRTWIHNQVRKNPDFKYILVPERHKDGAIHFHALMSNYPFSLKKTNVIQENKRVYNVTAFRFGFTAATYLPKNDPDSKSKAGNYIAKYITKDMITIRNKHRYLASKNLQKPITRYNDIYDSGLHRELDFKTQVSESAYNTIFEIDKNMFEK